MVCEANYSLLHVVIAHQLRLVLHVQHGVLDALDLLCVSRVPDPQLDGAGISPFAVGAEILEQHSLFAIAVQGSRPLELALAPACVTSV